VIDIKRVIFSGNSEMGKQLSLAPSLAAAIFAGKPLKLTKRSLISMKKMILRTLILIAALCLLALAPTSAIADGPTPEPVCGPHGCLPG